MQVSIRFQLKIREGGHWFDKIYLTMLTSAPTGLGSAIMEQKEITLNVSDDVKKTAVEKVLNAYVEDVLTNEGEKINAWTVVSNPFC